MIYRLLAYFNGISEVIDVTRSHEAALGLLRKYRNEYGPKWTLKIEAASAGHLQAVNERN